MECAICSGNGTGSILLHIFDKNVMFIVMGCVSCSGLFIALFLPNVQNVKEGEETIEQPVYNIYKYYIIASISIEKLTINKEFKKNAINDTSFTI